MKLISQKIKKSKLCNEIDRQILPLIKNDYVLFGLPYYSNIGDTLIWEGELEFLKQVPYKCVGVCGWNNYPKKSLKSKDTIILITGGGYFGDIWRNAWDSVLNCIKLNSENKIIILPNTIHYSDFNIMLADAAVMAQCKDITICARDYRSFDISKKYFKGCQSLLVPDMAFYINNEYLKQWELPSQKKALFLKRIDKELSSNPVPKNLLEQDIEIHDWPTMEYLTTAEKWFDRIERRLINPLINELPFLMTIKDKMYSSIYRPIMTRRGTQFISSYNRIYTTRLHVLILSVLLEKEVYLIDNNYGKLSTFYDTWLSDCQNTYIYNNEIR